MDEARTIALFPLNICLLPGEDIPLKIFEPRYKQLINDCEREKFTFGIPFMFKNEMQMHGTEVKLNQIIARNSHGEMVIMVECVSNFEMVRFNDRYGDRLYSGGIVKTMQTSPAICNQELLKLVEDYTQKLDPDFFKTTPEGVYTSDDIARVLNLSSEDKFIYLSFRTQAERETFLLKQVMYMYKLREQEKLLNNDYYLN